MNTPNDSFAPINDFLDGKDFLDQVATSTLEFGKEKMQHSQFDSHRNSREESTCDQDFPKSATFQDRIKEEKNTSDDSSEDSGIPSDGWEYQDERDEHPRAPKSLHRDAMKERQVLDTSIHQSAGTLSAFLDRDKQRLEKKEKMTERPTTPSSLDEERITNQRLHVMPSELQHDLIEKSHKFHKPKEQKRHPHLPSAFQYELQEKSNLVHAHYCQAKEHMLPVSLKQELSELSHRIHPHTRESIPHAISPTLQHELKERVKGDHHHFVGSKARVLTPALQKELVEKLCLGSPRKGTYVVPPKTRTDRSKRRSSLVSPKPTAQASPNREDNRRKLQGLPTSMPLMQEIVEKAAQRQDHTAKKQMMQQELLDWSGMHKKRTPEATFINEDDTQETEEETYDVSLLENNRSPRHSNHNSFQDGNFDNSFEGNKLEGPFTRRRRASNIFNNYSGSFSNSFNNSASSDDFKEMSSPKKKSTYYRSYDGATSYPRTSRRSSNSDFDAVMKLHGGFQKEASDPPSGNRRGSVGTSGSDPSVRANGTGSGSGAQKNTKRHSRRSSVDNPLNFVGEGKLLETADLILSPKRAAKKKHNSRTCYTKTACSPRVGSSGGDPSKGQPRRGSGLGLSHSFTAPGTNHREVVTKGTQSFYLPREAAPARDSSNSNGDSLVSPRKVKRGKNYQTLNFA